MLEEERGLEVGSMSIQCLVETSKGVVTAHESANASKRVNSLAFGAVDFTKDMQKK